jgi:putative cardiolipin synthase
MRSRIDITRIGILVALLLSAACATLPPEPPSEKSYSGPATLTGVLALTEAAISPPLSTGESAFHLLPAAQEALAWRLILIDSAEHSIDAQYFVWHDDAVGSLMLEHLYAAADRGVRVRLLVDDLHLVAANTLQSNDDALAAVDHHPNLELRLFNPGKYRSGTVGALGSFADDALHYNRRMHNKLLQVDGHFAIVGGRNIGDEYFGLAEEFNFVDLDVLVAGTVIAEISAAFDQYWNAELTYPAGALGEVTKEQYQANRAANKDYLALKASLLVAFDDLDHGQRLDDLKGLMKRGTASFFKDEPIQRGTDKTRLYDLINEVAPPGSADQLTSTPYLIPASNFLQLLEEDLKTGATVRLLTNSLATNNQPAVHSHYKTSRQTLADMGVELFELHHQPTGTLRQYVDTPPIKSNYVGLHMKASVLGRDRCFIGTLNLDPRSIDINTEDVLYIESPDLCGDLHDFISSIIDPSSSWAVTQDEEHNLQWTSFEGTVHQEPARKTSQRLMDFIYQLIPKSQL